MIGLEPKHVAMLDATAAMDKAHLDALHACFAVLALASAIDRDCAERLRAHDLSEGRFVLLVVLANSGADLAPHVLAEEAGVTRATVTGLLDGLERGGLARREPDAVDRRALRISLTPAGRTLAAVLLDDHADWIANLMSDLDDDDRRCLVELLGRIRQRTASARAASSGAGR